MFIYGVQCIHLSLCWKCNDTNDITAPNLTVFVIPKCFTYKKGLHFVAPIWHLRFSNGIAGSSNLRAYFHYDFDKNLFV